MNPFIWNWGSWADRREEILAFGKVYDVPPATRATLGGLLLRAHRIMLEGGLSLPTPILKYRKENPPDHRAQVGPYWCWGWPAGAIEPAGSVELAVGGSSAHGMATIQLTTTVWGHIEDPSDTQIWRAMMFLADKLDAAAARP